MIQTQLALIQRELWEHRSIYVTPAAIGLIICLMIITGQVSVSAMGQHLDFVLLGASALGENERAAALTGLLTFISLPLLFSMLILTMFYSLDCLYAERKDRSILFWRSIPITDSETIASKLIIALVVIPLVAFLLIMITHLVVLLIASVWVSIRGADAWYLIWSAAPLFDSWMVTLITMLAMPLWLSPFIGWFLFVSAFTKRSARGADGPHPGLCRVVEVDSGHDPVDQPPPFSVGGRDRLPGVDQRPRPSGPDQPRKQGRFDHGWDAHGDLGHAERRVVARHAQIT